MAYPASDVYAMCRSLLNDQNGTIFTDAVLQPFLNIALRDLGGLMARANIPVTNVTSAAIDVDAGVDNIGDTGPALPSNLTEIQGIYQRQADTDEDYFLITRYEFLPHIDVATERTTYIPAWAWIGQVIRFIPANSDLQVKIDYIANAVPEITDESDQITLIDTLNYLGYRTGALAAMFIGENSTRAAVLDREAEKEWDLLEGVSTKGRQSISTRRRPFRSKNWGGSSLGW